MGEPSISKGAVVEALRIVTAAKFTGDDKAFEVLAAALQRHMDLHEHAKAAWDRSVALSAEFEERAEAAEARVDDLSRELTEEIEAHRVTRARAEKAEASKAELIADVEDWMSDALIELPHDAVDLSRILDKHRGQP